MRAFPGAGKHFCHSFEERPAGVPISFLSNAPGPRKLPPEAAPLSQPLAGRFCFRGGELWVWGGQLGFAGRRAHVGAGNLRAAGVNVHAARGNLRAAGLNAHVPGLNLRAGGLNAQVPGLDVRAAGLSAQVPGLSVRAAGRNARVPGRSAQVPGRSAQVPGFNAHVEGSGSGVIRAGGGAGEKIFSGMCGAGGRRGPVSFGASAVGGSSDFLRTTSGLRASP